MCVLLVEDETLIRALLADALSEHGFTVQEAANGHEAEALLDAPEIPFTLLVSDVNLPGGTNGFAVARAFRLRYPDVPIVLVTGRPYHLMDFPERGPHDVLLMKPFTPSQIIDLARTLTAIEKDGPA